MRWNESCIDLWFDLFESYKIMLRQKAPLKGRSEALALAKATNNCLAAAKKVTINILDKLFDF